MLTIKQLREKKNISQSALAEKLGVSLRTVQNYEANQDKIPLDKLSKIYRELKLDLPGGLSLEDVFEHNGKTTSGFIYPNGLEEEIEKITGYYLPEAFASAGLENQMQNDELKRIPVTIPGWEKEVVFINVYGDSMYPKYNAGEIIGVKPIEFDYLNYGSAYVVVLQNGDTHIKIVQPGTDKEHLVLESVNEFYKPKEYHLSKLKSFYSIKGVIKKEMM